MSEEIIHTADLREIENSLHSLHHNLRYVTDQVDSVNAEVLNTQDRLQDLIKEFHEYVRRDQLEKNLQLAETRVVKVRQELESTYGHYSEVRRRVTGILQAADVSLVKQETIENVTEEHMLAAPRYWLAPCLIALSAWLNDKKELADKAMKEALRRDDEKASLFFALVTRRGARYRASREWLDRYFGLQDPHSLEREIVILIDGFANGIFGPDARAKCGKQIGKWIDELSQQAGFTEEQHAQWKRGLQLKVSELDEGAYPYLKANSPTWPQLKDSLEGAKLHRIIHDYFQSIFMQDVIPAKSIAYAVDALLDTLVSKFDEEELPLRRNERLLSLIIQEDGDKQAAQKHFDGERALEERVSFTQLLTNFAMQPEVSNASLATQKLSIALSKDWIQQAHDDITAENRAGLPIDISLEIDQWKGSTRDGANEDELVQSLEQHVADRKSAAVSKVKLKAKHWAALAGGLLFAFWGIGTSFFFIIALGLIGYFFYSKNQLQKNKDQISAEFDRLFEHCRQILLASLAEVVDWRKEYEKEDAEAYLVSDLLATITPEQYSFSSHDPARSIVN